MNPVTVLLAVVILLSTWTGYRRGFVKAATWLGSLFFSVLLALLGYRYVARLLEVHAPALGVWCWPLGFVATWLVSQVVLGALGSALVRAVPRRVHAHGLNRALGAVPGFASGMINASLVSVVLLTVPIMDGLSAITRESQLANRLSTPAAWVDCHLSPIFEPAVRRTLQALTVPPESRSAIELHFTVATPQVRPELESEMIELVNASRATAGLQPLRPDPELAQVARAHSKDMLVRGYFAHVDPEGKDLSDRIRVAKLRYFTAGENLAFAPTVALAHQNLMNSPGHRENLLRSQFTRIGVGVLDAGRHGLMVTENFRD